MNSKFFKFVWNSIFILFVLFVILVILTPTPPPVMPDTPTAGGNMNAQSPAEKLEAQCRNLPTYADSDTKDLCSLVNRYGAKRAMEMVMEYGKNTY